MTVESLRYVMSLSERSRSALYLSLVDVVHDERAVEEMLSYFPARDVEEPVTKEFFRAEMAIQRAEVQAEFAVVRSEFQTEFAAVRSDMQTEFAAVRSDMQTEFAAVRSEFRHGLSVGRTELHDGLEGVRSEMHRGFQRQTAWLVTTMVAMNALTVAAVTALN